MSDNPDPQVFDWFDYRVVDLTDGWVGQAAHLDEVDALVNAIESIGNEHEVLLIVTDRVRDILRREEP